MAAVFLKLLNMSITAGWLILAVIVIRLVFRKAPRRIIVLLWGLVALRLLCPVSVQSILSLVPSTETVQPSGLSGNTFTVQSGIDPIDKGLNGYLGDHYFEVVTEKADTGKNTVDVLGIVWLCGVGVMLSYSLISFLRLRKQVSEAVRQDGVWLCDRVESPFILGIIRPRIYLPTGLDPKNTQFVLAHENAHIRRGDHVIKPLGFLLLSVYWFNPLIWLGFVLLCRDIELACDERVIEELGSGSKCPYSEALLDCSVPRSMIAACPLAFGEVNVKGRIKSVLTYKKPAFWVIVAAVLACIVVAVCFLTDPKTESKGAVSLVSVGSDLENSGFDIKKSEAYIENGELMLEVTWLNGSGEEFSCGEPFELWRIGSDGFDTWLNPDQPFELPAYPILPGKTLKKTYNASAGMKLEAGVYVFRTEFSLESDHTKNYAAWAEIQLHQDLDGIVPQHTITVKHNGGDILSGTLRTGGCKYFRYEFQPETGTTYHIHDNKLSIYNAPDEYIGLGMMEYLLLDKDAFIGLMGDGAWRNYALEGLICSDLVNAKKLTADGRTYLALALDNGEAELAILDKNGDIALIYELLPITGNGLDGQIAEFESAVAWAGYSSSPAAFGGCLNAGSLYESKLHHLPLYKIAFRSELEGFKERVGNALALREGMDEMPSFEEATKDFDDAYFAEYTVFVAYLQTSSTSFRYRAVSVDANDGTLSISVVPCSKPEAHDTAMGGWWIIVSVDKGIIPLCTGFDAILIDSDSGPGDMDADTLNELLNGLEAQYKTMQERPEKEDLSQTEYNANARAMYDLWKEATDSLYMRLSSLLQGQERTNAGQKQALWEENAADEMQKAGAPYEGGSMKPMIVYMKGAELYRERAYELARELGELMG